jgi:NADPH2 dehydrogenase
MNDWHFVYLGHLAYSGAGLLMVEATHVTREGRITHGCTGLYTDHNEASMARVLAHCRTVSKNPIGIQIGHAGRKASTQVPWEGREALGPANRRGRPLAPCAAIQRNLAHAEGDVEGRDPADRGRVRRFR